MFFITAIDLTTSFAKHIYKLLVNVLLNKENGKKVTFPSPVVIFTFYIGAT